MRMATGGSIPTQTGLGAITPTAWIGMISILGKNIILRFLRTLLLMNMTF